MIEHTLTHSSVLPNGITVISEHTPSFKSASVAVAFAVGSIQETEEQAGIAHLLEHLVFRGAEGQTGGDLHEEFARLGGRVNGYTNEERTAFTANVLSEDVPEVLTVFAKMLHSPALRPEDIDLEKQIVDEESCRGCFNCTMRDAVYGTAFPDQPLRRPVIGYEDTLKNISRQDIAAFHAQHYVGVNLVIAVASALQHDKVVALVEASFGGFARGEATPYPALRYEGGDLLMGTGSEQSTLRVLFDVTGLSIQQGRALCMFAEILGGHATSLLMNELREKRGLVYGVWSDLEITARVELLEFSFDGAAKNIAEIAQVGMETIRNSAFNVTAEELAASKRRHYVAYWLAADNLARRADDIVAQYTKLGRVTNAEESFDGYQSLTVNDIRQTGQLLLEMKPTLVLSAPLRQAPKFDAIRGWLLGEETDRKRSFFRKAS